MPVFVLVCVEAFLALVIVVSIVCVGGLAVMLILVGCMLKYSHIRKKKKKRLEKKKYSLELTEEKSHFMEDGKDNSVENTDDKSNSVDTEKKEVENTEIKSNFEYTNE